MKTTLLYLTTVLLMQYTFAVCQNNNWVNYDINNSDLPSNSVYVISFDQKGNAWIGTDSGLTKFDGKYWNTFKTRIGSNVNPVRSIAFDKHNNIWVGTDFCLRLYCNDMTGVVDLFNLFKGDLTCRVGSLSIDSAGNIWIGTSLGVARVSIQTVMDSLCAHSLGAYTPYTKSYALNKLDSLEQDLRPSQVVCDPSGNIWTANAFLRKFDGETFHLYDPDLGMVPKDYVVRGTSYSYMKVHNNDLWIAAGLKGLFKFNGSTFKKIELPDGYHPLYLTTIGADLRGDIWLGLIGGLLQFNGTSWFVHNDIFSNERFNPPYVNTIAFDTLGNAWIGTNTGIAVSTR